MRSPALCIVLVVSSWTPAFAQIIPFDSDRWQIQGATSVRLVYEGQDALYLKGASAAIVDTPIENGVIEFDIAFSTQRGFSGVFWRMEDDGDREEFYFRPHQSGNPDANQYNPVLSGVAGWQLYYGPSYAAPIRYRYNEWMHVRVVFSGSVADFYVDSEEPVLSVNLKNPPIAGSFGIYASGFAPAYFANFQYRGLDRPVVMGAPVPEATAPEGAVMLWDVSSSFDREQLEGMVDLPAAFDDTLSWTSARVETTGIVNFCRHASFGPERNTVLARTTFTVDAPTVRVLRFGYSDRAAVYLNGLLVYRGSNDYQSRDYRYLGTIGLFDEVPLRFREGRNELTVAVSESFGGWGLIATLE
ncbi:MAG TPA: hypothetical protein VJB15_12005 [Rhodothermia bacterium]|nr:hypothetical protein [Rhodothermia bacterium]